MIYHSIPIWYFPVMRHFCGAWRITLFLGVATSEDWVDFLFANVAG